MLLPYVWLLLFFLAPFLIILKISFAEPVIAQPPFTSLLEWGEQGFEGIRATFENYLVPVPRTATTASSISRR